MPAEMQLLAGFMLTSIVVLAVACAFKMLAGDINMQGLAGIVPAMWPVVKGCKP